MGRNAGVKEGDVFIVRRVIKEIRDDYGKLLDVLEDDVGEVRVAKVLSKSAICKLVRGDAKKGDKVVKK